VDAFLHTVDRGTSNSCRRRSTFARLRSYRPSRRSAHVHPRLEAERNILGLVDEDLEEGVVALGSARETLRRVDAFRERLVPTEEDSTGVEGHRDPSEEFYAAGGEIGAHSSAEPSCR